jgi:hypothetical protein
MMALSGPKRELRALMPDYAKAIGAVSFDLLAREAVHAPVQ